MIHHDPAGPLVLGIGQRLRRDDGVGWAIAEQIATEHWWGARVILGCQLVPEWSEFLANATAAVIVDAAVIGDPGTVTSQRLDGIEPDDCHSVWTHDFSPRGLLAYATQLWGRVPPTLLVTVAGEDFEIGEGFSPAVEQAIPTAIARIRDWFNQNPASFHRF